MQLSYDIKTKDGIANAALRKIAERLLEQQEIIATKKSPDAARIGGLIATHDNREIDQPIFVVEKRVTVITDPDYGYDDEIWVNKNDYHDEASEAKARRLDILDANFISFRRWRKFYIKETWEFVTACLTEQGCNDYLEANGHNIGKTRIYAYGSFRNK